MAAVDRDEILKKAEKLLRQGKVSGAIEEYVRLIEAQPKDWNTINALGDLYLRAGDAESAVAQFKRVADHLFQEGFYPKAGALYKKALKAKSDDEQAMLQLGEIAARQGLLADAKLYFRQVSARCRQRGDTQRAAESLVRLGSLEIADAECRIAGARAAQQLGNLAQAASLLKTAADDLDKAKRHAEALDLLVDAAQIDPADVALRARLARACVEAGNLERARVFLTLESAGDDPDLLLALGTLELAAGHDEQARLVFMRLLMIDHGHADDVVRAAQERAAAGHADSAFGCVEVVADNALLMGEPQRAVAAVRSFVTAVPSHIPALQRLVELCVDAELDEPLADAQRRLADAHLEAGNGADARFIAEDLVDRDPSNEENTSRLRRVLELLGVPDVEQVISDRLSTESEVPEVAGVPMVPEVLTVPEVPEVREVLAEAAEAPYEIDLSDMLAELEGAAPVPTPQPEASAPGPPPDLEDVFAGIRTKIARDQERTDADAQYDRAMRNIREGRIQEAVGDLQAAARVPMLRFVAAAQLGRLYVGRGELKAGVDWLERAAEAPAPTANEGFALLYDLADALERMGESARALAILMELEADAADYRDVRGRIDRLSRVQAGSPRA